MRRALVVAGVVAAIAASLAVAAALAGSGDGGGGNGGGGGSGGGGGGQAGSDVNLVASASAQKADELAKQIYQQQAATTKTRNLCAIAVMAGPASSPDIRLGIFNTSPSNTLDVLIEDSFNALGGQSLLHQSVFLTAPPAGGTLTVEYPPDEAGKGPIVLSFTGFDPFESASYNSDPDTYDDPDFGAFVQDMDGTRLEGVFSGGLRCAGTLKFNGGLNASIAYLTQTYP